MIRGAVILGLVIATACVQRQPPAATTTATPAPAALPESEAWSKVRATLPGVPIILPTWLPPTVDRSRVELRMGHAGLAGQTDPRYELTYLTSSDATILFALGPASDIPGSGIGTRVRNSSAVLSFDTGLFSDASRPAPRRIRWQEGPYILRIESDRFTGNDLLHIAWSLDRTGQPTPKNPYTRVKPGVCAATGARPDDTVRRLLALVGSGDRDAVADCYSLELLGEHPGYRGWADLPKTSDTALLPSSETGGRVVVPASWTFASDPGGAWGQQAFQVFVLGLEDGSWRIYETATGWYAPPP